MTHHSWQEPFIHEIDNFILIIEFLFWLDVKVLDLGPKLGIFFFYFKNHLLLLYSVFLYHANVVIWIKAEFYLEQLLIDF